MKNQDTIVMLRYACNVEDKEGLENIYIYIYIFIGHSHFDVNKFSTTTGRRPLCLKVDGA